MASPLPDPHLKPASLAAFAPGALGCPSSGTPPADGWPVPPRRARRCTAPVSRELSLETFALKNELLLEGLLLFLEALLLEGLLLEGLLLEGLLLEGLLLEALVLEALTSLRSLLRVGRQARP
jgi:hypothetical protein